GGAVGRVLGVGDGHIAEARQGQVGRRARRLGPRGRPDHQPAARVERLAGRVAGALARRFVGRGGVGGGEEVEGRALDDLPRQQAAGAEAELGAAAGLALEERAQFAEGVGQVGGGGEAHRRGRLRCAAVAGLYKKYNLYKAGGSHRRQITRAASRPLPDAAASLTAVGGAQREAERGGDLARLVLDQPLV